MSRRYSFHSRVVDAGVPYLLSWDAATATASGSLILVKAKGVGIFWPRRAGFFTTVLWC